MSINVRFCLTVGNKQTDNQKYIAIRENIIRLRTLRVKQGIRIAISWA